MTSNDNLPELHDMQADIIAAAYTCMQQFLLAKDLAERSKAVERIRIFCKVIEDTLIKERSEIKETEEQLELPGV